MTYFPPASPVNLDASSTSLSAGSLTTVARADHVHTVSNAMVLIAGVTLASASASYTFTSIPQSHRHLLVVATFRGDASNPTYGTMWAQSRYNGDTGANYGSSTSVGETYGYIGYTVLANNYYPLSAGTSMALIGGYTSTAWKTIVLWASGNNRAASQSVEAPIVGHVWKSTAAITSIQFFPTWGNFAANTTISLYGI